MDNNKKQNQNMNSNWQTIAMLVVAALLTIMIVSWMNSAVESRQRKELSYNEFVQMVEDGKVESIRVKDAVIEVMPKAEATEYSQQMKYYVVRIEGDYQFLNRVLENNVITNRENGSTNALLIALLNYAVPFLILLFLMNFTMKRMGGGGIMGVGKSNAKMYVQKETGITFKDVAGEDEAKESLTEIVDFLHNPGKYTKIGAKLPKGALLVGPPGTGKTLLAKAVAGEAHVPFYSLSGSDFVEMFVGVGASRVRDLFKNATENAPCIIFIDEIDAIGRSRDSRMGGNDEREQTLNQLLTEMDGFDGKKGVVILAATNRPESLDPALLRPGRFDRRVPVELPDLKGREAILKVHGQKVKMSDDVDYNAIARATAGASGAELANIVNEAALRAVRFGRKAVCQEDLQESVETVIAGYQKKNAVIPPDERRIVAYHEVGHALVAACQTHSAPVQKITIIPRTSGALGYTMQVDQGERYLMSRDEALNKIATFTGGRAAEEVIFHSITTGASNDIEQATKIARAMVTRYGMTDEFDMVAMETVNNQYLGGDTSLMCSPETAKRIDEKVVQIVREQHEKAIHILKENETKLHEIAAYLLDKETITGEEFMEIFEKQSADGENTLKEEE